MTFGVAFPIMLETSGWKTRNAESERERERIISLFFISELSLCVWVGVLGNETKYEIKLLLRSCNPYILFLSVLTFLHSFGVAEIWRSHEVFGLQDHRSHWLHRRLSGAGQVSL